MSRRAILAVRVEPQAAHTRARLENLLRYLARPEGSLEACAPRSLEHLARWLGRSERTEAGQLFEAAGAAGPQDLVRLSSYVAATSVRLAAYPRWHGQNRAYYSLVISPEDERGLDLRRLTRRTMERLEDDCGGLPPWLAAEHHNTAHAHAHVVLAAQRELDHQGSKTLLITRARLTRMKEALAQELGWQRDRERAYRSNEQALTRPIRRDPLESLVADAEWGSRSFRLGLDLER